MSSKKSFYMSSTEISPSQTAGEIVSELVRAGANSINTDYKDGQISGIRWVMVVAGIQLVFDMPVRIDPVHLKMGGRLRDRAQAERTAWRQLLRWVQAQNAMIDTGMAQPCEVFLAYLVDPATNRTLFDSMLTAKFKALNPGAPQ